MRTEDLQGVAFREWVLNYIQYYYLIVLHKKRVEKTVVKKISETEKYQLLHTYQNIITSGM
jgi:hypothetical protein